MASAFAFQPSGPTILVGATTVAIGPYASNSLRIRNLAASAQYFTYGTATPLTSVGAPTAGVPSGSTIGMNANEVKTFTLSGALYMIASSATGFEVTPGDGV